MTPIDTLHAVLKDTSFSPLRKLRSKPLIIALFGFAAVGLIIGLVAVWHAVDRRLDSHDVVRVGLLNQAAASNAFRLAADLERSAVEIEDIILANFGTEETTPESQRDIIRALEAYTADDDLIQGGALILAGQRPALSFGIEGRFASESAAPDSRLMEWGKIDADSRLQAAFVRLSDGPRGSLMIFSRPLFALKDSSLFLAVPYSDFYAFTCSPNPERDTCALVDADGALIDPSSGRREHWLQNARQSEEQENFDGAAISFTVDQQAEPYGETLITPIGRRNISVATAAAPRNWVETLFVTLGLAGAFVAPSLIGVLLIAGFVQNEWRTNDVMITSFAEYARGADSALRLAEYGMIFWRARSHDLQFSEKWFQQLGLDHFEPDANVDMLTGRLHPDEREEVVQGYEAIMDGTKSEIIRRIRLRNADGKFVEVNERVTSSELGQDDFLVILHRLRAVADT